MCNKGITQFYLPPTHEPYLPLLPSRKTSPSSGWYSLRLPTKGWPGWVDLGGWLHTEYRDKCSHLKLNPDTVTDPSTNRARRRLTSLIESNVLPLRQTATRAPQPFTSTNIILLCDRGMRVWTTCPFSLRVSGTAASPTRDRLIAESAAYTNCTVMSQMF